MSKQSVVLLISSIVLFVFGIVMSILAIVFLDINIIDIFNNYPVLKFILCILLIIILAYFITLSIRVYRKHVEEIQIKEKYNMVKLDNLTQIFNFEYFITLLQTMETPFSLVMLDIDNFKEINEKFDAVIGDLVLKVVAKSIKENIRLNDIVARYQGDAFLVILQNCPPRNAKVLMNIVRNNIKDNERLSEKNIKLSTSVGIEFVSQKKATEDIFRNTVEALCQAKTNAEDGKVVLFQAHANEKKVLKAQ